MARHGPVIVITGTPGTGKSTHAELLQNASPMPLKHVNVGDLIKEKGLHDGFDDEWGAYIVDEDKVLDELESMVEQGDGLILDWHTCDLYPERWPDLVVVLRCDHSVLWERLEKRNYPLKKVQENNESEIMQVVLDEAKSAYPEEVVVELRSETTDDIDANVDRLVHWVQSWQQNEHPEDAREG